MSESAKVYTTKRTMSPEQREKCRQIKLAYHANKRAEAERTRTKSDPSRLLSSAHTSHDTHTSAHLDDTHPISEKSQAGATPAPASEGGVAWSGASDMPRPQNDVSSSRPGIPTGENHVSSSDKPNDMPPTSSHETVKDKVTGKKKSVWNVQLSARQGEALNAVEPFLLYGGAKGGGKSWFLCIWMFIQATKHRGNKLFFCRRRSVDFTNTTLETWKKSIPSQYYRINEQKKKIYVLPSNSVIDYGGLDDPLTIQSLNSAEYAKIGVDQAEEIDQDSFAMLRGTLRHRLPDGTFPPYEIRLTANPAQCWLKNDFITQPRNGYRYIPALPTDNPYLPKGYVENLSEAFKHRPALLAAYLRGSWDDLSGHDTCIRGSHIEEAKQRAIPNGKVIRRIIVNDPAITGDENVTMCLEQIGNVVYIKDRYIIEHKRPLETAALLSAYRKRMRATLIAFDKIGIGESIQDGLSQLEESYLAINSAATPSSQTAAKRYGNLRAQMWWEAGDKFARNEVCLPPTDIELARQLGSVRFNQEKLVKLYVQSKAEIKADLGRSPDDADCFIMGLWAIDQSPRLDEVEVRNVEIDRAGRGIPLNQEHNQDFSGYNMAEAEEEIGYGYTR